MTELMGTYFKVYCEGSKNDFPTVSDSQPKVEISSLENLGPTPEKIFTCISKVHVRVKIPAQFVNDSNHKLQCHKFVIEPRGTSLKSL
jgi:hypothetical protein